MKLILIISFVGLNYLGFSQTNDSFLRAELEKIKVIPSYSHDNMSMAKTALTIFDSSFSKIVKIGPTIIPDLIRLLKDTSYISITNPCWEEQKMRLHDVAWFLINEIEPFPRYEALKIQFCTSDLCDHFPQGFFNFIHSDPAEFANRYQTYFYSKDRKKYLKKAKRNYL